MLPITYSQGAPFYNAISSVDIDKDAIAKWRNQIEGTRMRWTNYMDRKTKKFLLTALMSLGPLFFYPGPWSYLSVLVVGSICSSFLVLECLATKESDANATVQNKDRSDFFGWCISVGFLITFYLLAGSHYVRAVLAAVFFWGALPWLRKAWGLTGGTADADA